MSFQVSQFQKSGAIPPIVTSFFCEKKARALIEYPEPYIE